MKPSVFLSFRKLIQEANIVPLYDNSVQNNMHKNYFRV